jgi:AcrR family transcriptional regulator
MGDKTLTENAQPETSEGSEPVDIEAVTKESASAQQRRLPKQGRSRETVNAIVEAAAELFETRGYEQTTTHQVAAAAGISVGALYRYFGGKEAILREVYQREMSALRKRVLDDFTIADLMGQDMRQLVRKAMVLAFRVYSQRPQLRCVLVEQARKVPELAELRLEQEKQLHDTVKQILKAAPGVNLPDPEIGAYLISLFMERLIDDYTMFRKNSGEFDEERVIDAAVDFILRYALGRVAL